MQEAYVPPVQLDKSESNWDFQEEGEEKPKTWNCVQCCILELEPNYWGKKHIFAIKLTESTIFNFICDYTSVLIT